MMLLTFASPSHLEMCNRFVVANAKSAGFTSLNFQQVEQVCESGNYNDPGFAEAMLGKLELLAAIPIGQRVCYVDADCMIFPGLAEWCEKWIDEHPAAIGHGKDSNQFCMGTLVFEQTEDAAKWWQFMHQLTWMLGTHDQMSLNALIEVAVNCPVELRKLDNQVFANWATRGDWSKKYWNGEPIETPETMLCWHANYCIGVSRKIEMLEIVEKRLTLAFE